MKIDICNDENTAKALLDVERRRRDDPNYAGVILDSTEIVINDNTDPHHPRMINQNKVCLVVGNPGD